ncbi:MAG: lysine transporter LysE [Thermomicrobiales bacterium]|nr:MAG: lysine transporter LysE [Thermomicrobiales bacterium]
MDILDARFASFLAVSALLIVTPGPDMALVTRNALIGGRRAGAMTAVGVGLGILGWAMAATFGIAGLLNRSAVAFHSLKLAGAAYLMVLGIRSLRGAARTASAPDYRPGHQQGMGAGAALRQGTLGNLLNPKAGVIFLSIVPQFVAPGDAPVRLLAMLIAFEAMIVGWLVCYGSVVSSLGRSRLGTTAQRALERLTGVVLIWLGVRLATERR